MKLELFFSRTIVLALCVVSLWSCGKFKAEHSPDVVAECCGQVLTLDELEKLIGLLGYEFTEEFKAMSEEDKKTKGYEEL